VTRAFAAGVAVSFAATVLAGAAGSGVSTVAKAPPPAALVETESSAEDLVDVALAGDRAAVVVAAARLKAVTVGPAASALGSSGVPPDAVARLQQRADRVAKLAGGGSFVEILLAANAVSELMPSLYGHFRSPVPPAIQLLDYLDREVEFRSLAGQPRRVVQTVAKLGRAWTSVRPRVTAAGGRDEVTAYNRHVAAMERLASGTGKALRAEAVRGLELVDQLESVFTS
jgi:hypothetical protein